MGSNFGAIIGVAKNEAEGLADLVVVEKPPNAAAVRVDEARGVSLSFNHPGGALLRDDFLNVEEGPWAKIVLCFFLETVFFPFLEAEALTCFFTELVTELVTEAATLAHSMIKSEPSV